MRPQKGTAVLLFRGRTTWGELLHVSLLTLPRGWWSNFVCARIARIARVARVVPTRDTQAHLDESSDERRPQLYLIGASVVMWSRSPTFRGRGSVSRSPPTYIVTVHLAHSHTHISLRYLEDAYIHMFGGGAGSCGGAHGSRASGSCSC